MASSGDYLSTGDNGWQMTASTLVGLQGMVGLVLYYGGLVKKKWAVNSAFMVVYAFAAVLVCWVGWAYKFGFGNQLVGFWGRPGPAVGGSYYMSQATLSAANDTVTGYPTATMIYFQGVFAAVTLGIVAGALLGRMNFLAWMLFVPLWLTLSYTVTTFTFWAGGFMWQWGVIDYSGGYVIHLASAVAGYTAAAFVGPRLERDRQRFPPNNVTILLFGAGVLWLGWNGFNGGDPYSANQSSSVAVLNTNICTAVGVVVWATCDFVYFGKPSVIGAVQGMIAGLVTITPAAGFIHGWGALIFGIFAGTVPWFTMNILGKQWALLRMVDDCAGILHTHAVTGFLGGMLTSFFAVEKLCVAFALPPGTRGVFYGNGSLFHKQLLGALFVIGWNVVITSGICILIRIFVPLRMSLEHLEIGDEAAHGEEAYAMYGDGDFEPGKIGSWYGYDITAHGAHGVPGAADMSRNLVPPAFRAELRDEFSHAHPDGGGPFSRMVQALVETPVKIVPTDLLVLRPLDAVVGPEVGWASQVLPPLLVQCLAGWQQHGQYTDSIGQQHTASFTAGEQCAMASCLAPSHGSP
eukprot:SM000208S06322  [mRNA]  locus=s208:177692:183691:+ [translate_table: standard]